MYTQKRDTSIRAPIKGLSILGRCGKVKGHVTEPQQFHHSLSFSMGNAKRRKAQEADEEKFEDEEQSQKDYEVEAFKKKYKVVTQPKPALEPKLKSKLEDKIASSMHSSSSSPLPLPAQIHRDLMPLLAPCMRRIRQRKSKLIVKISKLCDNAWLKDVTEYELIDFAFFVVLFYALLHTHHIFHLLCCSYD